MASSLIQPTPITIPWASAGNKRTIPNVSQIGTEGGDGKASYPDGYPPLCGTPLVSGGKPPSILDENGILFEITAPLRFLLAGGAPRFNADMATAINGYPVGAKLQDNNGVNTYINIVDGNSVDFNTSPASIGVSWIPYCGGSFLNSRPGHTYTWNDWAWIDKSSGLILQWLSVTTSIVNGADSTFTLPITFKNSFLMALACYNESSYPYTDITTPLLVTGGNKTSVTVRSYTGSNNGVNIFVIGN